jgi:carbamoyl-phosphate synthase large subunit
MSINNICVMFTCIGRRVSLLESFRSAAKSIELKSRIVGTDITGNSAALRLCDNSHVVRRVNQAGYIKELLEITKSEKVDLLVPTVDLDLQILADNKAKFAEAGCFVLVSDPKVVEICQDKRKTYEFLVKHGFETPQTFVLREALKKRLTYPRFMKPWDGYASRGNAIVRNREELEFFGKRIPNCIVQEFIEGVEYTCDIYVDLEMQVRCVVPRMRIETRSGEVSKGQVVKNSEIMETAAEVVRQLGAGPGVITLQCFRDKKGAIKITEINPRFGGGAPLSIKAGANFPKWIMGQLRGRKPRISFDGFTDSLMMLRYDSEVWVKEKRNV